MSPPKPLSKADEAEIQAQIAADPDDKDITDEELTQARPFAEVFPDLADSIRRSVGRPKLDNARKAVTIRLLPGTLEKFEQLGPDWRARMAEVLDKAKV